MSTCPLCISEQTTHWYDNSNAEFLIVDCPVCGAIVVVAREHGVKDLPADQMGQRNRMVDCVEQLFGQQAVEIDFATACAEGHVHAHVKRRNP